MLGGLGLYPLLINTILQGVIIPFLQPAAEQCKPLSGQSGAQAEVAVAGMLLRNFVNFAKTGLLLVTRTLPSADLSPNNRATPMSPCRWYASSRSEYPRLDLLILSAMPSVRASLRTLLRSITRSALLFCLAITRVTDD